MADAIVSAVLEHLVTILAREADEEVRLLVGAKKEVQKMRSTFQAIQAALTDAENRQLKEERVKGWLNELKHISYDIDDVLDASNTTLLKSKIKRDRGHTTTSIPSLLSKVCSCVPSPCSCFGGLALRHDIAIRIKELNGELQAISKQKDDFAFVLDLPKNYDDPEIERPKVARFFNETEIRGRDQDKDKLIRLLLSENKPEERGIPIISIVGMGGIGKTTLAQMVYNHNDVSAYFQEKVWVCVSDPFDVMRIAKAILESLTGSASDLKELNSVLEKIHETIVGKRYLLVLDDVWDDEGTKWQSLKNCLNCDPDPQGSKILVTTRKENVATVMGCTKMIHLGKLSPDDCWSLFSQIALSGRNDMERESLEDIGKKIADRCDGLPLAAKTVGGLLLLKKSREEWQRILDSPIWQLDGIRKGLFSPLLLSYYDLPLPLRQCFSYCAIFPKDHVIKKDLLIKLWMAQGFLRKTQRKKMEIIGEEYFDNLATRSFFQEFEKDEYDDSIIIGCKMHDMVHDLAQVLTEKECLLAESDGGVEVQKGVESSDENVRHLTLIDPPRNYDPILDPFKKLRSFLILSTAGNVGPISFASLPKLFDQLINLRMLSFHNEAPTLKWKRPLEIPEKIGKLIHLRYLSFEGHRILHELPEALCDLCNLQTLNIRWCDNLRELPCGMEKLINLRHLQNEATCVNEFINALLMPKGMQRLTSLQTLEEFYVWKKEGGNESETLFGLKDLRKLNHLRGNLKISGLGNVAAEASEAEEAQLSTKTGLRSLTLCFDVGDDMEQQARIGDALVLEALRPPQDLQILEIDGCKGPVYPNWMTSLASLKSVNLRCCFNWESLPPMGKLPCLEFLSISYMSKVQKVGEEFVGVETSSSSVLEAFPNLKELDFGEMKGWEEWEYEKVLRSRGGDDSSSSSSNITIMPKLQRLSIGLCPQLKTLPRHLLQSSALQHLLIQACPILQRRFKNDRSSISHIPFVDLC